MGRMRTLKIFAIGSGIAAAAGYVAGLMTAPKSGVQTRKQLQKYTNRNITATEKELKKLYTELSAVIAGSKNSEDKTNGKDQQEFNSLIDRAKDTKEKAREMISAVHEGGVEDEDLQKAIEDANAALKHIRDYLKK